MIDPEKTNETRTATHLLPEGAGWPLPAATYNLVDDGIHAKIGISDIGYLTTRVEHMTDGTNMEISYIGVSERARGKAHYDVAKSLFGAMKSMAIHKEVDTVSVTANNEAVVQLMVETFGEENMVISTLEKQDAPAELIESQVALKSLKDARLREYGDPNGSQMLMEGVRIVANINKDTLSKSSLRTILGKLQRTSDTRQLQVPEDMQGKFDELMAELGFIEDGPTAADVTLGVNRAEKMIYSGDAQAFLEQLPFKHRPHTERNVNDVSLPKKYFINPELITGAESFVSWAGRGESFKSIVDRDGTAINAKSIDVIKDYASRETKLPDLEDGITVHITDNGVEYYTANAHRTAAAILRQEPLGFDTLKIIDRRNNKIVITADEIQGEQPAITIDQTPSEVGVVKKRRVRLGKTMNKLLARGNMQKDNLK